ncbi:MAG: hypothetical protein NTV05_05125 [Acidobacteria bacterium]|nr:hypothetical protein [Acidobacteriota bacterium]
MSPVYTETLSHLRVLGECVTDAAADLDQERRDVNAGVVRMHEKSARLVDFENQRERALRDAIKEVGIEAVARSVYL